MGDILILNAEYTVGGQQIDVSDYVTQQQGANYGAIDFAVQKLDDDLRKDHRISIPADDPSLKLAVPRLTINYTDESGAYHTASYVLTEKVDVGERSSIGKFIQKPGDILWGVGLTVAKGQYLFGLVLVWALVVLWAFKQWEYLELAFRKGAIDGSLHDEFGVLGKFMAVLVYTIFTYGNLLGKPFQILLGGAEPIPGWIVKYIFSAFAVLTPVSSFFVQFLVWFTLVQTLLDKNQ
jgi:hypothetical protein